MLCPRCGIRLAPADDWCKACGWPETAEGRMARLEEELVELRDEAKRLKAELGASDAALAVAIDRLMQQRGEP